jgi:hypothetical protein
MREEVAMSDATVAALLDSPEPSIRYKARAHILGEDPASPSLGALREDVRASHRVRRLLNGLSAPDEAAPHHPYAKWVGAHWVLALLADLGYPPGDPALLPLRDRVYDWLLSHGHVSRVPVLQGRARRCASQEGNALWATLMLGLADERAGALAANLLRWQWPDGGWNFDKRPEADSSSFMESLLPLRALALHARLTGNADSRNAAARAAEVFLRRRLFLRVADGSVINPHFTRLHSPCYWHYDILFGLRVMQEAGFLADPRCGPALELLSSKRLADGGFPAEAKYYVVSERPAAGRSPVDFGPTGRTRANPWVTVDALSVLQDRRQD